MLKRLKKKNLLKQQEVSKMLGARNVNALISRWKLNFIFYKNSMFLKIIKLVSKAAKILGYGKPFPLASLSYWIASLPLPYF